MGSQSFMQRDLCDRAVSAEYWARLRAKKAASVAAGGKTGGWKKGKPRKPASENKSR